MGKYFGTDGIRGIANAELDARLAYLTGFAAAEELGRDKARPRVVICKDTRISGDMLESALIAGLCAGGADASPLGVLPTPAAALLTIERGADAGIVISASHNPYEHNGIKLFGREGFKIPDELEARIEHLIDHPEELTTRVGGELGRVASDDGSGVELYVGHVARRVERLRHMRVVFDCANGAASRTARNLFSRFDLDAEYISEQPDGVNINADCGSTHLDALRKAVVDGGFDCGFAFDGDADRCLAVDETGATVDGDAILALCAAAMKEDGTLRGGAVVGTIMSNSGLLDYCKTRGIDVLLSDVGDRNVLELMRARGCNLGGEPSGHTIFTDDSTTGDGQLAALKVLEVLSRSGKSLSELRREIPYYPQVMINVKVAGAEGKAAAMASAALKAAIEEERAKLGGGGKILVRPSGTESLIRVTVEARTTEIAGKCAERLVNLIELP
ncbi:MAG: phosphoglucosamine mutase [Oscillospiraceae bacterium]|jgi:phosphoglucosamine mutase|nr:phosphoglucosamine mutase [Oscillospiraceae bacterium]